MADGSLKSRTCAYCGARVWLAKAKRVASARSAMEATELVQYLKQKKE